MLDILESIRHRFASFDTLSQLTPISFINLCRWLLFSVIIYSCYTYTTGIYGSSVFSGNTFLAKWLRNLTDIEVNVGPGYLAMLLGFVLAVWYRLLWRMGIYFSNMWMAIYIFIIENKRIKKMSLKNKILFTLTWPTFDIIGRYTTYIALFMNVTWKPIPHESKVTIDDLNNKAGV